MFVSGLIFLHLLCHVTQTGSEKWDRKPLHYFSRVKKGLQEVPPDIPIGQSVHKGHPYRSVSPHRSSLQVSQFTQVIPSGQSVHKGHPCRSVSPHRGHPHRSVSSQRSSLKVSLFTKVIPTDQSIHKGHPSRSVSS